MATIHSKDTQPEMFVRRLVHSMGYRYRLHRADLPGKPDLVFASKRKLIFIHGCFWHQHGCQSTHFPKTNTNYWIPKLKQNKIRDAKHIKNLNKDGWQCLVLWECELEKIDKIRKRIIKFLK